MVRRYKESELISGLVELAKKYPNKQITKQFYEKHIKYPSATTIIGRIGWNNAKRKAGLAITHGRSKYELLEQFSETIRKLGYIPKASEYQLKQLKPHYKNITIRLGLTWDEWVEEYKKFIEKNPH